MFGGRRSTAGHREPSVPGRRVDAVVGCYLAVLVLAGVQAVVLGASGRTFRAALPYVGALVAYLVVRSWRRRGGSDGALLRGLAATTSVLAVWLVAAFAVALPSGMYDPSGFYVVKVLVTSPVGDHNTAAGLLLPGAVAAVLLSVEDQRWSIAAVVCGLGMVATLSRGAAVVLLVVAVALWPLVAARGARPRLVVMAGMVLAAVLGSAVWLGAAPPAASAPGAVPEVEGAFGASLVGRADLIARGAEVGLDRPVLGVGLGGFVEHASDLPPPNDHAHNLLTQALAEGGVLVLVVAAALPIVLILRLRRLGPNALRDVLLVGGAALVLHAQHDILGGLVGYEVLLAVLLAAACRLPSRLASRPHGPSGPTP